MRQSLLLALALGVMSTAPPAALPRGEDRFRLGMSRAQVDSAVAARELTVVSSGAAFLVCASDDPLVEYEQYSFFRAPHGIETLMKVTLGYRLTASAGDYAAVREELMRRLGRPATDSWEAGTAASPAGPGEPASPQQAIWTDASTTVQLGARWTGAPDRNADRMIVTWTDRRLQRLVAARRMKDRVSGSR